MLIFISAAIYISQLKKFKCDAKPGDADGRSPLSTRKLKEENLSFHIYVTVNEKPKETLFVMTSTNVRFNLIIYTAKSVKW